MNKTKIMSILIISLFLGAGTLTSISASEIDNGSLDVTINDGLWGTVSPIVNIPDQTSVTLGVVKINDTSYQVRDNLSIPLTITCNKAKVLSPKFVWTVIKARRPVGIGETKIKHSEIVPVYNGTILYDGKVPDMITASARYNISADQYTNGETMRLTVLAIGLPPGEGAPNQAEIDLDELLDLIPENWQLLNGFLIRLIKEFIDANAAIDLSSFPIIAAKTVDLKIDYTLGGEEPPVGYTLNVSVATGNGTIKKDPDLKQYKENTVVNLTAIPDPGFVFDHWSVDASGSQNPLSVTMDSNKTIQANFKKTPVLVKAAKSFNMRSRVIIQIVNQESSNITDAVVNITAIGGLFKRINTTVDETVNISVEKPAEFTVNCKKLFSIGSIIITVKVKIGTEVVKQEIKAFKIGPIILV